MLDIHMNLIKRISTIFILWKKKTSKAVF